MSADDAAIARVAAEIMAASSSRPPGKVGPDAYVWHIVLRSASTPLRPDRLATLVLDPADVKRWGIRLVERAIADSRRQWQRIAIDAGYVDGWTVEIERERGFVRSLFPGAAIAGAPAAEA